MNKTKICIVIDTTYLQYIYDHFIYIEVKWWSEKFFLFFDKKNRPCKCGAWGMRGVNEHSMLLCCDHHVNFLA